MIQLIQFPKPATRPSFSPFCLKLESYLKVAQVPYENKFTVSMGNSKKKKMPMILDGGELIEDSSFIIEYLKIKHGIDLDKNLTREQKAIARAFQGLCEKTLVDIILYFRWVDPQNWPKFRNIVFAKAPWLIKVTVANSISKNIKQTLYKHGLGRFTDSEKLKILNDTLSAISDYLGTKPYFFGEQVSSIDTILYSHLMQIQSSEIVPQFKGALDRHSNLKDYLTRFSKMYWPEYLTEKV